MKNFSDKSCRWHQNAHFMSNNLFRKSLPLWDNVEKHRRTGQTTDDNTAHAHWCWIPSYSCALRLRNTLLVHCNNSFTNTPECYVIRTLPVLLKEAFITEIKTWTYTFICAFLSSRIPHCRPHINSHTHCTSSQSHRLRKRVCMKNTWWSTTCPCQWLELMTHSKHKLHVIQLPTIHLKTRMLPACVANRPQRVSSHLQAKTHALMKVRIANVFILPPKNVASHTEITVCRSPG